VRRNRRTHDKPRGPKSSLGIRLTSSPSSANAAAENARTPLSLSAARDNHSTIMRRMTRRNGNAINAINEARSTKMPGSVATTDTISIHCGLNFNAVTTSANAMDTASNQDTYIAHRIKSGGTTQRNGREAVQVMEMQIAYSRNENRKFINESENSVKSVVACAISRNVFRPNATHKKFTTTAEPVTNAT
jgi:hypothetical protein